MGTRTTRLSILAAVAVAALGLLALLRSLTTPGGTKERVPVSETIPEVETPRKAAGSGEFEPRPTGRVSLEDAEGVLPVQVVDTGGRPVPGCALHLVLDQPGGGEEREVTTDLEGRVELTGVRLDVEIVRAVPSDPSLETARILHREQTGGGRAAWILLDRKGEVVLSFEGTFGASERLIDVRLMRMPYAPDEPDQETVTGTRKGEAFVFHCPAGHYMPLVLCEDAPPFVFWSREHALPFAVTGSGSATYVLPDPGLAPRLLPCRFKGEPDSLLGGCTLHLLSAFRPEIVSDLYSDASGNVEAWLPETLATGSPYTPVRAVYSWERGPRERGLAVGRWERDVLVTLAETECVLRFGELLSGAEELSVSGLNWGKHTLRGEPLDEVRAAGLGMPAPERLRLEIDYEAGAPLSRLQLSLVVPEVEEEFDIEGTLPFVDLAIAVKDGDALPFPLVLHSPRSSGADVDVLGTVTLTDESTRIRLPLSKDRELELRAGATITPGHAVAGRISLQDLSEEEWNEVELELVKWRIRCVDCRGDGVPYATATIFEWPQPLFPSADAEGRLDVYFLKGSRNRVPLGRRPSTRGQHILRWDVEPPEVSDLVVTYCTPVLDVRARGSMPLHTVQIRLEEIDPTPDAEGLIPMMPTPRSCDSLGHTVFRGLPPGRYRVIAFGSGDGRRKVLGEATVEVIEGEESLVVELDLG